jgi:micrococcal nuclease
LPGTGRRATPDVGIPPPPPDLNYGDIPDRNFRVIYNVPDPDPHRFDGDHDGIDCES